MIFMKTLKAPIPVHEAVDHLAIAPQLDRRNAWPINRSLAALDEQLPRLYSWQPHCIIEYGRGIDCQK
jgi:hypothetical protein